MRKRRMHRSTVLLALLSSKLCRTSVAVDYGWAVMLLGFALAWVVHWISKSSRALERLGKLEAPIWLEISDCSYSETRFALTKNTCKK
jgi:hypothetical protein